MPLGARLWASTRAAIWLLRRANFRRRPNGASFGSGEVFFLFFFRVWEEEAASDMSSASFDSTSPSGGWNVTTVARAARFPKRRFRPSFICLPDDARPLASFGCRRRAPGSHPASRIRLEIIKRNDRQINRSVRK
jgi:hypothetical protein